MRVLTLAVVMASLALAGAAQAECVGHKKVTLASSDSSLPVTTTQPASGSVAGTEKQTKKESGG